ncbi:MAG TPA: cold shock domain-containing protein [Nitrolancea sp.]|nr:cold shock domain-containing protein [Nitrolancea sp.]
MATGHIKTLVEDRGFGFIAVDDASSPHDVFFHHSAVEGGNFEGLREGQQVEFDEQPDPRNPQRTRAAHVRVSEESSSF